MGGRGDGNARARPSHTPSTSLGTPGVPAGASGIDGRDGGHDPRRGGVGAGGAGGGGWDASRPDPAAYYEEEEEDVGEVGEGAWAPRWGLQQQHRSSGPGPSPSLGGSAPAPLSPMEGEGGREGRGASGGRAGGSGRRPASPAHWHAPVFSPSPSPAAADVGQESPELGVTGGTRGGSGVVARPSPLAAVGREGHGEEEWDNSASVGVTPADSPAYRHR